jgi:hypothetical protein
MVPVSSGRVDVQVLLDRLGSSDVRLRKDASDALVALGAEAVGPVLEVLCDEESAVEWSASAWVLRQIGRPALEPLVEATVAAPTAEVARRASWAYSGLRIDALCEHLFVGSPERNGPSTPEASREPTRSGNTATSEFSQVGTFNKQN